MYHFDSLSSGLGILCKMHDNIKDSEIRLAGIDGDILPPNSKEHYFSTMKNFTFSVHELIDTYQYCPEIIETREWATKNGHDLQEAIDGLEECYAKYDDDEFIAAVDFMVLSKLHYILEYAYLKVMKECWTPGFKERLN